MGSKTAPTESPLDKTLANIGTQQYAHYQAKFVPLQQYAISQDLHPESAIKQAHGEANANYMQSFAKNASKIGVSQGQASGGSGTGRQVMGLAGGSLDQGQALGLGQADTQIQTQRQLATNLQNLMNIGQGQGNQSLSTLNSAADIANKQAATDSAVSAASRAALGNAAGVFTGLGGYNYALSKGASQQSADNILSGYSSNPTNTNYGMKT